MLANEFKIFEFVAVLVAVVVAVNVTTLHANGDGNDCNGNGNGDGVNVTTALSGESERMERRLNRARCRSASPQNEVNKRMHINYTSESYLLSCLIKRIL